MRYYYIVFYTGVLKGGLGTGIGRTELDLSFDFLSVDTDTSQHIIDIEQEILRKCPEYKTLGITNIIFRGVK